MENSGEYPDYILESMSLLINLSQRFADVSNHQNKIPLSYHI